MDYVDIVAWRGVYCLVACMMDALVADVQTYKGYEEREIERENGLVFNMFLWIKKNRLFRFFSGTILYSL